jgi:SAM-dependent methyltransferase
VAFVAVNAEQAEDWNGASGREFVEQRERHERMLGRLTARLLAAARIRDGENVLDIGCGCGDATILAARAAGSGRALGADLSRIQVAEARRLAARAFDYEHASPTAAGILAGLGPAQAAELAALVRDRLAAYASPDGVTMPGAAWLVTARAV